MRSASRTDVFGFPRVVAIVGNTQSEWAEFRDTPGDDRIVVRPGLASRTTANGVQIARGFRAVAAYSDVGGEDSIHLKGSEHDDSLRAFWSDVYMQDSLTYTYQVYNFEKVRIQAVMRRWSSPVESCTRAVSKPPAPRPSAPALGQSAREGSRAGGEQPFARERASVRL